MTSRALSGYSAFVLMVVCAAAAILGAVFFLIPSGTGGANGSVALADGEGPEDESSSFESDNQRLQAELQRERRRADTLARHLQEAEEGRQSTGAISGLASFRGKVTYADGAAAEGVSIKAVLHGPVGMEAPEFQGDIDAYEEAAAAFIARLRFTPVEVMSGKDGSFIFEGLPACAFFDLEATGADGFHILAENIAAGASDVIITLASKGFVITGLVKAASGTLPGQIVITATEASSNLPVFNVKKSSQTISGADPRFAISLPFPGRWLVSAEADGFYQAAPVTVKVDSNVAVITLEFHEAGIVCGTVRDTEGVPLAHVPIHVNALKGRAAYQATANVFGQYRFTSIPPGDYRIRAVNGDYSTTVDTSIKAGLNEFQLKVIAGATLTVAVRDEGNRSVEIPVSTKNFNLRGSDAIRIPDVVFGAATFQGIKPGSYELMMMLPGYGRRVNTVVINEGENTLTVSLAAGGRLKGCLHFDRKPPAKPTFYVKATRKDEDYKHYADPDQNGVFTFESLNLGEWTLEVMNWGTRDSIITRQVKIEPGDNFFEDAVGLGATLVIHVMDSDSPPRYACDVSLSGVNGRYTVETDEHGVGAFAGLEDGDYTLRIDPPVASAGMETSKKIHISSGDNEQSIRLDMADCLKITQVVADSNAAGAGVLEGDLLLHYNGRPTASYQQLRDAIDATKDGDKVTLNIKRDGKVMRLDVGAWKGNMLGVNIDKARSTASGK